MQVQKKKQKKKEKDKEIDEAIKRVEKLLRSLHLNTFYKYREAGKELLRSGYKKGKWRSIQKKEAIGKWAVSRQSVDYMLQLGALTETEFADVISKFPSLYAWVHRKKTQGETVFPPLPEGKFRTIIVDPPWPVKKILRVERPNQEEELDYETLAIKQIENDVGKIVKEKADEHCHVYLWTTHKFLPTAFEIFRVWGVKYECLLTWVKPTGMTPFSWMYNTEHVLFGRIESLTLLKNGVKLSFEAPVEKHSVKPDRFFEIVRAVSPEPRLEMFARKPHSGFEPWGDEVIKCPTL